MVLPGQVGADGEVFGVFEEALRDVAQQERVRERLRDVRETLACAVAARKRPMNAH